MSAHSLDIGQQRSPSEEPITEGSNILDTQAVSDAADETVDAGAIRPTAGSKRPLMTHTKDGKVLSEKRLRRLEKNRLSARECRRRKREQTEGIQREINVLEAENLRLRLQLQIGEEAEESSLEEQAKLTSEIDSLLKSGASEAEVYQALESFKEKHADYGRDRRSAIEFHLRNIERLLKPTTTTNIVMQAIQGTSEGEVEERKPAAAPEGEASAAGAGSDNTASQAKVNPVQQTDPTATTVQNDPGSLTSLLPVNPEESSSQVPSQLNPKGLFQHLVTHISVTPSQAAALKDSRFVAQELDACLDKAVAVLRELRERLAQTGADLEAEFGNVRSILTPTQAAKFLVWVSNNSACVHMLNELWERVYPASENSNDADQSP